MIATPKFCKCEECKGSGEVRPFEYRGETITACPWCQGSGKTEVSYVVRSHGHNGDHSFTEVETITDTLEEAKVYGMALMTTGRFAHVLGGGVPTVQWVEVTGPGIEESLGLEPLVREENTGRYEWFGNYTAPELVAEDYSPAPAAAAEFKGYCAACMQGECDSCTSNCVCCGIHPNRFGRFECHSCGAAGVTESHKCGEQKFHIEELGAGNHEVIHTASGVKAFGPGTFARCYRMGQLLEAGWVLLPYGSLERNPRIATRTASDGGTVRLYQDGMVDATDGEAYSLSPGFESLEELEAWITESREVA